MTAARPVWLTREQREAMRALMMGERSDTWQILAPIVNWWDAAPADPVEAALTAYRDALASNTDLPVSAVLRALGMPDPQPETTP